MFNFWEIFRGCFKIIFDNFIFVVKLFNFDFINLKKDYDKYLWDEDSF